MYLKNPYCPSCGVKMILPEDLPKDNSGNLVYEPDNMCTYEHVCSRLEGSKRKYNRKSNIILCKKCNAKLGAEKEAKLSKYDLWTRSGRWPSNIKNLNHEINKME